MRRHLSTHLPLCRLQRQMARHTCRPRQKRGKGRIQSHTPELPLPTPHPPTQHPPPLLPHPPLITSSILHLFKSLHFQCIHTFSISLCMSPPSLPPSFSPPPHRVHHQHPPPAHHHLTHFFLFHSSSSPPATSSFSSSLPPPFPPFPPSHYCNPSLFHQPPCKQASWLPWQPPPARQCAA